MRQRLLTSFMVGLGFTLATASVSAQSSPWATAYYAGWMQGYANNGHLPAENIDYSALTHIIHFALVPRSDGTLDGEANSITATNSAELISRAHAAGKKVLISVGGWNTASGFRGATSTANLTAFVNNLIVFMTSRRYDGIDIDWEVLEASDAVQYQTFITTLRTALIALSPRPLLTATTAWNASIFAAVKDHFDQINIMTYDLSGAWPGWVTWHNSPIYDGGYQFPSTGNPVPSIEGMVGRFIAAGIPAQKLGIGIDFYGYVWSGGSGTSSGGVTEPRQSWSTAPSVQDNVPYYTIMNNYYQLQYYRWDDAAQAAYLSIDNAGSSSDRFISYDDVTTIQKKIEYVRARGLGGLIVWELGGGYRSNQPVGERDLLLQALAQVFGGAGPQLPDTTPPTVTITWPTNGSSVSGTILVSGSASDNVAVAGVQFVIDGAAIGGEDTQAPFETSVNTTLLSNGVHTIAAVARDLAGNKATTSISVQVSNSTQGGGADLLVYSERLQSPWINASWTATVDLSNTERPYSGSNAIKVVQNPWGALSMHSGNWGSSVAVDRASYTAVEFRFYALSSGVRLSVVLENDFGSNFPGIDYGSVPENQWLTVSIPMSTLNPNNLVFHRLDILEMSGSTKTYYVDEVRFVGQKSSPPAPVLASPLNGTQELVTNPTLQWNPSTGTSSYQVQLSTDSAFAAVSFDQSGITSTSVAIEGLANGETYYWHVNATNTGGTSAWSTPWRFTTVQAPSVDTTPPVISILLPEAGATVSGPITISAEASDNVSVAGVQFAVDGADLGAEVAVSPYSVPFNTTELLDGLHTITATARDLAGNHASTSEIITVSNKNSSDTADLWLYQDGLQAPWINASWSATVDFATIEQVYRGTTAIKIVEYGWGAMSLHNGPWGSSQDVNTGVYTKVKFVIHGGSIGVSLGVSFENDQGSSFPTVKYGWIGPNQWTIVSIPVSQLNPNNQRVHRLVIREVTGKSRTFFVDDIRFVGSAFLAKGESRGESLGNTPSASLPTSFQLSQNYPNPFNPSTRIKFALPMDAHVRLEVFNYVGERVWVLIDEEHPAGYYTVGFQGADLPSGVYFYRLSAQAVSGESMAPFVETKKMILAK